MKKIVTLLTLIGLSTSLLFAKTLVTVNGHKITDSLLAQGYEQLDETKKSNLIEQLIKEEIIYAHLLNSSLVQSAEFQEAFNNQKNLIEQQYTKTLDAEQLRSIKGSIAVSLYRQKEFNAATATATETKSFYDNNPEAFNVPNSIEIANIIVQDKAQADTILKSLQGASNLDGAFIEAANAQKQNGYMGWFGRDSMPTNLFDKAYKYKVKRLLNAPVKTKHGYNVVYLLNKRAAGKRSYTEAKQWIEQQIKQKKVMDKLRTKMENLYGNAQIVY